VSPRRSIPCLELPTTDTERHNYREQLAIRQVLARLLINSHLINGKIGLATIDVGSLSQYNECHITPALASHNNVKGVGYGYRPGRRRVADGGGAGAASRRSATCCCPRSRSPDYSSTDAATLGQAAPVAIDQVPTGRQMPPCCLVPPPCHGRIISLLSFPRYTCFTIAHLLTQHAATKLVRGFNCLPQQCLHLRLKPRIQKSNAIGLQ